MIIMAKLFDICIVPQSLLKSAEIERNRRRAIQRGIDGDYQRRSLRSENNLMSKLRSVSQKEILHGEKMLQKRRVSTRMESGVGMQIVTKRFPNSRLTCVCKSRIY